MVESRFTMKINCWMGTFLFLSVSVLPHCALHCFLDSSLSQRKEMIQMIGMFRVYGQDEMLVMDKYKKVAEMIQCVLHPAGAK